MRGRLPSRHPTGLYVHSSPPTGVPVHDSVVRQWLRGGEMSRLKELVQEGEGASMVGEYSPDVTARAFIRALPRILSRIEEAHRSAAEGDLDRTERAIRRERAVRVELCKDPAGLTLLHKAVIWGHPKLQEWLISSFPELVHLTDRERRTALHYAGGSSQPEETWKRLTDSGADPNLVDSSGFTPAYYMHHPRRARPPQPRNARARTQDKGLVVKPANIRIWIHDRDLGRLQKVLWEGYGQKLLSETSTQPKVRRFLAAVPYILGSIRDVHKAAIENDTETLIQKTADPVPKDLLLSKDTNGLNPLHKAAGLGNTEVVAEILSRAPEAANAQDALGRTPLHYSAGLKDQGKVYQLLVKGGAQDHLQDKKGYTPSYYRSKPGELEAGKLLTLIPEAPRTAHIFPPSWDWRLLQPSSGRKGSTEGVSQESTAEEISKSEGIEESKPDVSEDEGVGSENAQSVEDNVSPQNGDNLDIDGDDEASDNPNQAMTISSSDAFGEDSGAPDVENRIDNYFDKENIEPNQSRHEIQESDNPEVNSPMENGLKDAEEKNDLENSAEIKESSATNELQPSTQSETLSQPPIENNTEEETNKNLENQESLGEEITGIPKVELDETGQTGKSISEDGDEEGKIETDSAQDVKNISTSNIEGEEEQEILSKTPNEERDLTEVEDVKKEPDDKANPAPLIRSETVILKADDLIGLGLQNNENKQEEGANTEEVTDKLANTDESVVQTQEDEINEIKPSENKEEQTMPSKTESGSSGKSSGRQSLKSRALKAIELGRGQEENVDSDENPQDDGHNESPENPESAIADAAAAEGAAEENNDMDTEEPKAEEVDNAMPPTEESAAKESGSRPSSKISEDHFPDSLEDLNLAPKTDEKKEESDERPLSAANKKPVLAGDKDKDLKKEAERLVSSVDMEGMAEMVLAGEGKALLDLTSDNPDVQLFINNVPQYMAKIERVHKASREGDLRGVQTSLDRRKFAVARDNGTNLKPTPLHVAVLFGRTSVLRYLAGRFPETMHAQDSSGRTPLHYATTLPDNGHFYSLLITLGADKALPDNAGRTAEYYLRNKEELTREMLLAEYQERENPIDLTGLNFNRYSDKGAEILREGYPIFKPEEGQYLASTLGEPLIKGLTEVAQLRPSNPIIHLANFLLAFKKPEDEEENKKGVRSIEGTPEGHYGQEKNKPTEEQTNTPLSDDRAEDEKSEERVDDDEDIDVIENNEEETTSPELLEVFKPVNRDEHGQSMLHFAAANSHGRNAMYQLLLEMDANPGLRDSLYRTARDIAEQANITDNIKGIDRFVVSLAARGEEQKLVELLLEGYDHILDTEDGGNILDLVEERGQGSVLKFLKGIPQFEKNREKLHRAIRFGSFAQVQEIFNKTESKRRLAQAKNIQGRTSLHVAVLAQHEATVEHISNKYPETLQIGDNLLRTPLHYAMALDKVESLSKLLIAAGAQRVLKDLKGRQPSYYFMNKTDIQKLQDEEEALRV